MEKIKEDAEKRETAMRYRRLLEPNYYRIGFAITGARYEEGVPFRETRKKAVDEIRKKFPDVPEKFVLVLWEGLPKEKYLEQLGHSNLLLINMFMDMISEEAEDPVLYISSPSVLGKSMDEIAQAVRVIKDLWDSAWKYPVFADGVCKFSSLVPMGNLLDMLGGKRKVSSSGFLDEYFLYQRGKTSIAESAERLKDVDGLSGPSMYRHISNFENSPVYAEYRKIWQDAMGLLPRRGKAPDCIEFVHAWNELEGRADRDLVLFKRFEEIPDIADVERVKLASDKRIALLKRKGHFKKALKEHGLEKL